MSARKKLIYTIVVFLALSAGIKAFLPEPEHSALESDRFWTLKTHSTAKYNVVIGGDSRVYRGINPDIIEAVNPGLSAINLGYSSGGFGPLMFDLIKSRLSPEGRKIIILGITPFSLTPKAIKNEHLQGIMDESQSDQFKHLNVNPLMTIFKTYKPRYMFKAWLGENEPDHYYQEYHDNGWVKSDRQPHNENEALNSYRKQLQDNSVEEKDIEVFMLQVSAWNKEGIEVIGFRLPSSRIMEALEDSLSGYNESDIRHRFEKAGGKWLQFSSNDFESYDGSHLDYISAEKLSKEIAANLTK